MKNAENVKSTGNGYSVPVQPVSISGVRKQEILAVRDIPYSMTDKQTGKPVSGVSRKVCFLEYTDGEPSGMFICKAVSGFQPPVKQIGFLAFDRFGKACGFQPEF